MNKYLASILENVHLLDDKKEKLGTNYPKGWFSPNPMGLELLVYLGVFGENAIDNTNKILKYYG